MALGKEEKLQGISQSLVMSKTLTKEEALKHVSEAKSKQLTFAQYLIENKIVSAIEIAMLVSRDFGVPVVNIDLIERDPVTEKLISEKLVKRHNVVPLFKRGDSLFVALEDPSTQTSLKEIQFHTGLNTYGIVVESDKLHRHIDSLLNDKENAALGDYLEDSNELDGLEISSDDDELEEDSGQSSDDAPIVRFVHKILLDAVKQGSSDLHFEPYEKRYRIRFRTDGILLEVASPPINLSTRITARIKVMSNLDISERRIPQDGRFKLKISRNRSIDFRVSTCPTVAGEKVVMRILDPSSTKLGVDALGFNPVQRDNFMKAVFQPQGMVLVTGPTGSGKTVTLYTALNLLNNEERNISTAEDPVELKVTGINQVNMHPKAGLTFAETLRSFLRQDPDIIMVGEIRDLETASIAIKAAQTGHMVLSTLHTNSAAETLTRLVNMGVPPFNIAGSVSLIIAQRLGRRLCEKCKQPRDDIPQQTLIDMGFVEADLAEMNLHKAVGCAMCNNGYKGRIGLFEVMPISKKIGQVIMENGNSLEIENVAKSEGMTTIRDAGLRMIKEGISSIEEINRVTKD
jgi:type IV pilus assembly protein PilB